MEKEVEDLQASLTKAQEQLLSLRKEEERLLQEEAKTRQTLKLDLPTSAYSVGTLRHAAANLYADLQKDRLTEVLLHHVQQAQAEPAATQTCSHIPMPRGTMRESSQISQRWAIDCPISLA